MRNSLKLATILLLILASFPALCQNTAATGKKPYVVIKFDDLTNKNWKNWKPITDIILEKNVTGDLGIFVESLASGDQDYLKYVQRPS